MQLYEVVMEENKIGRLDLDWEIEIFVERFFGFFRLGFGLGDFWREGEKFFFSAKI